MHRFNVRATEATGLFTHVSTVVGFADVIVERSRRIILTRADSECEPISVKALPGILTGPRSDDSFVALLGSPETRNGNGRR